MSLEQYLREKLDFAPIAEAERPATRVLKMPEGSHTLRWRGFNPADTNTVLANYFQAGPGTIRSLSTLEGLMVKGPVPHPSDNAYLVVVVNI